MSLLSETINSGSFANLTGNALEKFAEGLLISQGYIKVKKPSDKKCYISQYACGLTIYDSTRKCDFMIYNNERFREGLIIECKWQQSVGSVDEKYPFLVQNIWKSNIPTIILIDGGGYKPGALTWLKSQVDNKILLGVYTMSEFQIQVNKGFLK